MWIIELETVTSCAVLAQKTVFQTLVMHAVADQPLRYAGLCDNVYIYL